MEATVRTAFEKVTKKSLANVNIIPVRGFDSPLKFVNLTLMELKSKSQFVMESI
jgi:hypothetical protein